MLRNSLWSFSVGAAITKLITWLISTQLSVDISSEAFLFGTLIVALGFYRLSNKILVRYKWFRYLFNYTVFSYEGFWATQLEHPKYKFSLAEIKYLVGEDRLVYRGKAYSSFSSSVEDGEWASTTFLFDGRVKRFVFTSVGSRNIEKVKQEGEIIVEAYGELVPDDSGDRLEGKAVDLTKRTQLDDNPLSFKLNLYRVPAKVLYNCSKDAKNWSTTQRLQIIRETIAHYGIDVDFD